MDRTSEVISAFLDDEPVLPDELEDALSDPAGRALLIDWYTLRRIVQPNDAVPAMKAPAPLWRHGWRLAAAAAALLLTLAAGYVAGQRRLATARDDAPPATRIVEAIPFVPTGGM